MDRANERKLGILLTTSPEDENTHTAVKLAQAALARGWRVEIFLMCDGVYNAQREEFLALGDQGARLSLCALNAQQRYVPLVEGILFGGQYDLATIVAGCDRFLAFN
jgi:sulfur relay (sulfurtransferase) complex TusBCD TusD component (DsrE family)